MGNICRMKFNDKNLFYKSDCNREKKKCIKKSSTNNRLFRFHIKIAFLIFLILLDGYSFQRIQWCWTKSMANEPSYKFNAAMGGINWGYCIKETTETKKIKYAVSMRVSAKK